MRARDYARNLFFINSVKFVARTKPSTRALELRNAIHALPRLVLANPGQVAFAAVTLGPVSKGNKAIGERECYRLGRLFFDGADAKWIAGREQITQAEVQRAWEFCREKLSLFFAAADGEKRGLLSDAELYARSEDCVRLLLQWYEVLSENERWSQAVVERRSNAAAVDDEDSQ